MQFYFRQQTIKIIFFLGVLLFGAAIKAQTTAFTYQGKLSDNGTAANGVYEMQFRLFDNPNAGQGTQLGSTVTNSSVQAANGIFTVPLDFGAAVFAAGGNLYLEISVRPAGNQGGYTSLAPRQPLTSAPYAIRSASAGVADSAANASNLGGVAANQFVQTNDARLSDAREPLAGSGNYVQNTQTAQIAANFNIDGTGTANVLNAGTQFNLGGTRILSVAGTNNLFAGFSSGENASLTSGNAAFGKNAGKILTIGSNNAFFGLNAGAQIDTGNNNSFFGASAGSLGGGSGNSFFGASTGLSIGTGSNVTLLGANANTTNNSVMFGTALGAGATVSNSNSIVLGRSGGQDSVLIPGNLTVNGTLSAAALPAGSANYVQNTATQQAATNFNISGNGTAGGTLSANTINAATQFNLNGNRFLSAVGQGNLFGGVSAGQANTNGTGNTYFGTSAGKSNTIANFNSFFGTEAGENNKGAANSFFGWFAGQANTTGAGNVFFGNSAGIANMGGAGNSFLGNGAGSKNVNGSQNSFVGAVAAQNFTGGNDNVVIGYNSAQTMTSGFSNTIIGTGADVGAANLTAATAIGAGATVNASHTIVLGTSSDDVRIPGNLVVSTLGAAGSTSLCRNANNEISTCTAGNFAEQNAPENAAALDALREQNLQMQRRLDDQQVLIESLKKIVCAQNPRAEICR